MYYFFNHFWGFFLSVSYWLRSSVLPFCFFWQFACIFRPVLSFFQGIFSESAHFTAKVKILGRPHPHAHCSLNGRVGEWVERRIDLNKPISPISPIQAAMGVWVWAAKYLDVSCTKYKVRVKTKGKINILRKTPTSGGPYLPPPPPSWDFLMGHAPF